MLEIRIWRTHAAEYRVENMVAAQQIVLSADLTPGRLRNTLINWEQRAYKASVKIASLLKVTDSDRSPDRSTFSDIHGIRAGADRFNLY